MAKRRHVFLAHWGPETEEKIKLANNKIRFDLLLSKGDSGARI